MEPWMGWDHPDASNWSLEEKQILVKIGVINVKPDRTLIFEASEDEQLNEMRLQAFQQIRGTSLTRICDNCEFQYDYRDLSGVMQYKWCHMKFDLCGKCRSTTNKQECPPKFGCNKNS